MMERAMLALVFVLGFNPVARAEVTYLTCAGMMSQNQSRTLSIVIDSVQNTAAVDDYMAGSLENSKNIVVALPSLVPGGPRGMLNRITV